MKVREGKKGEKITADMEKMVAFSIFRLCFATHKTKFKANIPKTEEEGQKKINTLNRT